MSEEPKPNHDSFGVMILQNSFLSLFDGLVWGSIADHHILFMIDGGNGWYWARKEDKQWDFKSNQWSEIEWSKFITRITMI